MRYTTDMWRGIRRRTTLGAMFLAAGLACLPVAAFAETAPTPVMERTPHYTLSPTIGPTEAMIPAVEATHGQTGNISSSPMSHDAGTLADQMDQGMANHRLEVHITQVDTGAVVMDVTPTTHSPTNLSGTSRDLPQVMGMCGSSMGMSDFHYGQNVFLTEGAYLVKVLLGPTDTAEFRDVMVAASPTMMTDHAMPPGADMANDMGMAEGTARDGRMFSAESAATRALFTLSWGDHAAQEWVRQHNAASPG